MKARASVRALVVSSLVATACSDPAEPPLPGFSVSPATQWSGGGVTVRSSYFSNRTQAPIIVADGDTLPLTAVDDSTVTTLVPQGPSGPVVFALARGTRTDSLGTVARVGYSGSRTVNFPTLDGLLVAADSAGAPEVFGAISTTLTGYRAQVARLKVVPGVSQLLDLRQPDKMEYGMAPSITPGVFAVRDSTDTLRMARLVDDVPTVTGTVPWVGTGTSRQVSLLSTGIWLLTFSHFTRTRTEADSSIIVEVASESPYRVFLSPRGDRTTLATVVTGVEGGIPVFDNATGTVAYRLSFRDIRAAAFSPDGATMYVAGGQQYSPDSLLAVDAASGTVQVPRLRLPLGLYAMGLAYRPTGDQLLVGATDTYHPGAPTNLYLLVYRASTLELIGTLPSPFECGELMQGERCHSGVVTLDDAHDTAYIVVAGSPNTIVAFDLVSAP